MCPHYLLLVHLGLLPLFFNLLHPLTKVGTMLAFFSTLSRDYFGLYCEYEIITLDVSALTRRASSCNRTSGHARQDASRRRRRVLDVRVRSISINYTRRGFLCCSFLYNVASDVQCVECGRFIIRFICAHVRNDMHAHRTSHIMDARIIRCIKHASLSACACICRHAAARACASHAICVNIE